MIHPHTLRLSYIVLTITLAVILISSPVIALFSPSPPIALTVGFASASSESGDEDESNTDDATTTTTDDGGEGAGDGEQQQEENNQQQQLQQDMQQEDTEEDQDVEDAEAEEEQEEQFAFMGGEICDDFQDNDGDGLIDLADTDCGAAAGPLTQGTVTAPTTPSPPPSVINTTATNSTSNTLTSGLIGLPSLPATPPPPQSPPPTTTTAPQGGEQEPVQQPQSQQQVPGTTSPDSSSASGTTTFPGSISITKGPDGGVSAIIPDSGVTISSGPNGVHTVDLGNAQLSRGSDGSVNLKLPNAEHISLSPDGIGQISLGDTTITGNRDGTLTIEKPYVDPRVSVTGARITNTYSLDGNVATKNPDGSTTSAKIGSVDGGTTTFPGSISIRKDSDGRVSATIPDKDSKEVTISSGPNGGVDSISHWDDDRESQDFLGRGSDGSVKVSLDDDYRLSLSPDGIGQISLDDDETTITGNRDGTLTIEKPYVDPNTRARGASITTTYKAPAYP